MSKPINIDNKELILRYQRKRAIKKLLEISAKEIASIISELVKENCIGCRSGHLSQTHHRCLSMEVDEKLLLYFDQALERVPETNVMNALREKLNNTLLLKEGTFEYTEEDWKPIFCSEYRQALKRETSQLL